MCVCVCARGCVCVCLCLCLCVSVCLCACVSVCLRVRVGSCSRVRSVDVLGSADISPILFPDRFWRFNCTISRRETQRGSYHIGRELCEIDSAHCKHNIRIAMSVMGLPILSGSCARSTMDIFRITSSVHLQTPIASSGGTLAIQQCD